MNLVLDIGNTHIKAGLFEKYDLKDFVDTVSFEELLRFVHSTKPVNILLCTVIKLPEEWKLSLEKVSILFMLDYKLPIPVKNLYKTPQTLGMDRLAGVSGANHLFPQKDCLVIDIGTCMKFDFIDKEQKYPGGSISPGLYMRFQAMNHFTSKLPLLQPSDEKTSLIGTDTQQAMQSGVINGMLAEIDGIIDLYKQKYPDIHVILCGGDAYFFETKINHYIFAVPKLVLIGLNSILQHNVSKT